MIGLTTELPKLQERLARHEPVVVAGRVQSARGLIVTCRLPTAVGDQCEILTPRGRRLGEVIGFSGELAHLVLYDAADDVAPELRVVHHGARLRVPVGAGLLGRVIDGLGRPLDERGELRGCPRRLLALEPPSPMRRARVREKFVTGLRAIDGLLTCGLGQRLGIFAGSGVGKSTLLGEIAKNCNADVNVLALIGERGREVQPFLEDSLGSAGRARSVVVVATCDQSPLLRVRAAQSALAIADDFRAKGRHVMLLVDSLTRLAMAQRELGIALGEPPSSRGYTPSVFSLLARYVEQMGNSDRGSITGILTVLVDGDDFDEPVTDAVRSFIDGHIVLDRKLAEANHYPAISIGRSISRIAIDVTDPVEQDAAGKVRAMLATFTEAEELLRFGGYKAGSSPAIDRAVELRPAVLEFLRQRRNERSDWPTTRQRLLHLAQHWPY